MIGNVLRGGDVIELLGGIVLGRPLAAGGGGNRAPAVVGDDEMRGIVRINPQIVKVAMRAVADVRRRFAAILRAKHRGVLQVDDVRILGIGEDVRVVEGALANRAVLVDERPVRAGIVALEQPALLVLDERVHAIGVRAGYRNTDAPHDACRHAGVARDLRPCLAAIGALEQPAASSAAGHLVFLAIRLPHRRIHDVGIVAVHGDVDCGGVGVAIQHFAPALAAVGALVDAALLAGHAVFPEHGDEDDVGVRWMDADLRDRIRRPEPDVAPRLARVRTLVDAIARHDVAADAGLAHSDEHDVRIGLAHGDGAHGGALDLTIRDRRPVLAAVTRLPEPAAGGAEVRFLGATDHTAGSDRPAAAAWTDVAPDHPTAERGIKNDGRERACRPGLGGRGLNGGHRGKGSERGNGQMAQRAHTSAG